MFLKNVVIFICVLVAVNCNTVSERKPRFFFDIFSRPRCICPPPPFFCDNDPTIVLGYCCGCRPPHLQEFLPVECPPPPLLFCPINGQQLCDDFERMMFCCCS